MSESTHVYNAELIGTPDVALTFRAGTVTLDAGRAPHVEAQLTIGEPGGWDTSSGRPVWVPAPAVLAALDPRVAPRVRITADAVFAFGTQTRTFDLAVRKTSEPQRDGTVRLRLTSDESLLEDRRALADDDAPFALAGSLRAVIDYVLADAIPGAALQASPAIDADLTPYWTLTNMMPNPSVANALGTYYIAATGTSAVDYSTAFSGWIGTSALRWTATAAATAQVSARQFTAAPGRTYTASAYVRSSLGRSVRLRFNFRDSENELISTVVGSAVVGTANWTDNRRATITAQAPAGTARVGVLIERVGTGTSAAGDQTYADAFMLYEGDRVVPYFDGTTASPGYTTTWLDVVQQSPSRRDPIIERDPEAVIWRAGQTALDFLSPLVQAAGYRLVCDESRQWTLRDEHFTAPGQLSIAYAENLTDGESSLSLDEGLFFDAAVTTYRWTDRDGIARQRVDAFALTDPYKRCEHFERDTAYPGPGFSEYAVRRAQGRGRVLTASAVSDWEAAAEQLATITFKDGVVQVGQTQSVEFDMNPGATRDEMTITTRTVEIAAGAIDLLAGTIDSLSGTIDSL